MAATLTPYQQFLKDKGFSKSTKATAKKFRAQRANYSRAQQVAQDPLSVPYGSDLIWHGAGTPNLKTLRQRGFTDLTTMQTPQGGQAVYGYNADPTPQWAKDILSGFQDNAKREQAYAQNTVMPWAAHQTAALQSAQDQAQTSFANLIGQTTAGLAGQAAAAGPGAQFAPQAQAPFMAEAATGNNVAAAQAQAHTAGAAYQGAVDSLHTGSLAQTLNAGLAQQVAAIPGKWDLQARQFQQQLAPVLAQIESTRQQGEFQRQQALEQRRQFDAQNAVEQQIAGVKADATVTAAQTRAQAQQQAAQDKATQAQYRSVAQIRSDTNKGDLLLDNKGTGFDARPQITKYHGKRVAWEQAQNGKWYGIARAGTTTAKGSGGAAPDSIYRSSTTKQRLTNDFLLHYNGDPNGTQGKGVIQPWKGMKEPGVADATARQIALWALGNKQFLQRGGKLNDGDLRAFFQSVAPEVDYTRIRYYINRLG